MSVFSCKQLKTKVVDKWDKKLHVVMQQMNGPSSKYNYNIKDHFSQVLIFIIHLLGKKNV